MDKGIFEDYERCLQDEPAACTARCPFHVDLPLFCAQVAEGDFDEAFRTLQKRLPLAGLFCLICEHPCETVCVRQELSGGDREGAVGGGAAAVGGGGNNDGAVSVHELERAAVSYGWAPLKRKFATSKKNGRVAVVGGGISGLAAAMELDRKGYKVEVFEESSRLGGSVWELVGERLSLEQIERELRQVGDLGIQILYYEHVSDTRLAQMQADYDAVFLGTGSWDTPLAIDPATLQVSGSSLFAGGGLQQECDTVIAALYSGKKAAISIERYIKKVSLTAEREREGVFSSLLPYNTAGLDIKPPLVPAGLVYTQQEAQAEATRCLNCRCDECLKACAHIQHYGRRPKTYAREIYTNENVFMGTRYANHMINSCTLCGLCKQRCPIDIGMAELVRYARHSMVESNKMPPSAHDFALRDMEFSNSERFFLLRPATGGGAATGDRAAVTTAAGDGSANAQYLFYPGCQLSASSPEHVQQAYRYLDARLGSNVGLMLGCCGAPADWAGRDDLMWQSAERIRQAWLESGEPTFILCCSSCADVFARYLPEIQTTSLWAMICQLGLPDKPATTGSGKPNSTGGAGCASGGEPNSNALNTTDGQTLSIHDACSARYDAATQRSVRDIATALGYSIAELKYSGADTKCCGYGGLVFYANREQEQEFAADRAQESPHDLLVYCAMCKDLFVTQGKPSYHLLDLLFADDPSSYALRRMPTLSERQANRSALRSQLLAEFWGENTATTPRRELDFSLLIPSKVQQAMEERLILVEDLEDVLLCALSGTAGHFHNIENDSFLASLRKGYVTYWVHYLLEDMANLPRQVRVLGVYSHRMDIIKG